MTESVRLIHWGMEGVGSTAEAACEDAERKIAELFNEHSQGWYAYERGHLLIVRRQPVSGWVYQILTPDLQGPAHAYNCAACGEDFDDILRQGARAFAQRVYANEAEVPQQLCELMHYQSEPRADTVVIGVSAGTTQRAGGRTVAFAQVQTREFPRPFTYLESQGINGEKIELIRQYVYKNVYGLEATPIAARAALHTEIARLIEGSFTPWYVRTNECTLLVWREMSDGWRYQIFTPNMQSKVDELCGICPGLGENFALTCRFGIREFAVHAYQTTEQIPDILGAQLMQRDYELIAERMQERDAKVRASA